MSLEAKVDRLMQEVSEFRGDFREHRGEISARLDALAAADDGLGERVTALNDKVNVQGKELAGSLAAHEKGHAVKAEQALEGVHRSSRDWVALGMSFVAMVTSILAAGLKAYEVFGRHG